MVATKYHKGYTPEQRRAAARSRKQDERAETRFHTLHDQEVIVWDGEGMKLSGDTAPQHYVLFGSSARPDAPLRIGHPTGRLTFQQIADYALAIALQHPQAIHLGYYFSYDQNMIIWSLPWPVKQVLYESGSVLVKIDQAKYYVRLVFGKTLRITRIRSNGDKVSILIEDFAPFFASSFVKAYTSLFPRQIDGDNWRIVKQGKADRSIMLYDEMDRVITYWRAEIIALQELAFEFRRIMFDAGFMLSQWHGPGALANYIRRVNGLIEHEWGGKEKNLPAPVHEASKAAYFGGHVEYYMMGHITEPVYAYDINSAYPAAFCTIPSLAQGGEWHHVGSASLAEFSETYGCSFGVFYIRWRGKSDSGTPLGNRMIQPLPHRNRQGDISYPTNVEGWYWAPEAAFAMGQGAECLDGWVWLPAQDNVWPWEVLFRDMYSRRRTLKRNKNPTQMAFKLGLNSLYGKMAQRVGGKEEAPKSHTLPIAGYVTSYCRMQVMMLMLHCEPNSVISVETDGVYTTTPPQRLTRSHLFPLSDKLGEWDVEQYNEMIMLQNGVYLLRKGSSWQPPKTRGISANVFLTNDGETNVATTLAHLATCVPNLPWATIKFEDGERFTGLNTAIARSTRIIKSGHWSTNPFKASRLHCTWFSETKELDLEGRKGKRRHESRHCRACKQGLTPADGVHDMVIHSIADIRFDEQVSTAYRLPWEKEYVKPKWHLTNETEGLQII